MGGTGLFWRRAPNYTLAITVVPGIKKREERITALMCGNADGSDKVPIWIIGHAMNPRAFKNINNKTSLGCIWQANSTAENITVIMREWLEWFDFRMKAQRRMVVLLLDNFRPHENAVEDLGGVNGLSHVRILWLPPLCTSRYQPMDQGIIRTWKAYYRQSMIRHIIQLVDTEVDLVSAEPYATINVLHAICWAVEAWKVGVKASTLEHCFSRSQVKMHGPAPQQPLEDNDPEHPDQ